MSDPRLRLLLLRDFFFQNTDEAHTVTMPELLSFLSANGIGADRRTVYGDIALLRENGTPIEMRRSRTCDYYLASRAFELPELKLLVDAVQSCRFLTVRKSTQLIEKLSKLTSRHQAAQLSRQVYVRNRLKTDNERIYYNVDGIHTAIQQGKKISFQYCQYALDKTLVPRHHGEVYVISPYLLTWAEDSYYLIGDHPIHQGLAHFRVDKMRGVTVLDGRRSPLSPLFDPAEYAKSMFSMYAGERIWVKMQFSMELTGVVIDRFGVDVPILENDEDSFIIQALVSVSPSFFGWLAQFGDKAAILSPAKVRMEMVDLLSAAQRNYAVPIKD